jgi:hypothetical protein
MPLHALNAALWDTYDRGLLDDSGEVACHAPPRDLNMSRFENARRASRYAGICSQREHPLRPLVLC